MVPVYGSIFGIPKEKLEDARFLARLRRPDLETYDLSRRLQQREEQGSMQRVRRKVKLQFNSMRFQPSYRRGTTSLPTPTSTSPPLILLNAEKVLLDL